MELLRRRYGNVVVVFGFRFSSNQFFKHFNYSKSFKDLREMWILPLFFEQKENLPLTRTWHWTISLLTWKVLHTSSFTWYSLKTMVNNQESLWLKLKFSVYYKHIPNVSIQVASKVSDTFSRPQKWRYRFSIFTKVIIHHQKLFHGFTSKQAHQNQEQKFFTKRLDV